MVTAVKKGNQVLRKSGGKKEDNISEIVVEFAH